MNVRNVIFPMVLLKDVKDVLKNYEGQFTIRYRGPRRAKAYPGDTTGQSICLKKDATGFVVYGSNVVIKYLDGTTAKVEGRRMYPL